MGYAVRLTIDADILDALRETAKEAPRAVQVFVERTVKGDLETDLNALRYTPPPPHFPRGQFPWKSQRQRRAYFATNGFGGGIPYRRGMPGIASKWKVVVELTTNSGLITAGNDSPAAPYVYAPHQQPFHANRWPDPDRTLLTAQDRAVENLIAGWYSIADPLAKGVRFK